MKKLLVVLLVLGLAAPAMAADWNFYGSARTHLGYYMVDEDFGGGPATDGTIRAVAGDDDAGTNLNLYGQSRLGAKVVASDNLTGFVEFGLRETSGTAEQEAVYLRLIGGTWNFGAGSLTMGKTYTPGTFLGYSGMGGDLGDNGDANMLVAGLAYIGRQPQIRLTFGGFDFALIQPNTGANDLSAVATAGGANVSIDKDFVLPRIEASYVFRTPVFSLRPVVGYQTYDVEAYDNVTGDKEDDDITSYMAGLGATVNMGPAYVKATISYLQNPGNYGQSQVVGVGASNASLDSDGEITDAKLLQGTFVVGANLNEMLTIEAGFGYAKTWIDDAAVIAGGAIVGFSDYEQTGMLYYLQAPIRLAKGVTIIPEVGFLDRDELELSGDIDSKTDLGNMTYVDVNFRVDF